MVGGGRAMPVVLEQVHGIPSEPFGRLTEALDQLRQGEVYLAAAAGLPCASWGEILTATAIGRGAAGAVIDGFHRDTVGVLRQQWPVFSRGAYGQDAGRRDPSGRLPCPSHYRERAVSAPATWCSVMSMV